MIFAKSINRKIKYRLFAYFAFATLKFKIIYLFQLRIVEEKMADK